MRSGFTTGACACAAALASVLWQIEGHCPETVEIELPDGGVYRPEIVAMGGFVCGVIKDAGDDPDVTNGLLILAKVDLLPGDGALCFAAGAGVGTVTRLGMKLPIGEAAINPGPRALIERNLRKIIKNRAARVTVSIPDGEKIAQKTFNPRLGIVGGLSILGTSGIVRPMSEEAIRETVALEMRMRRAEGRTEIALTFGAQGEDFLARAFPKWRGAIVQISNFVGFALDTSVELGFERVFLAGHPGKLCKVAAGSMQTHSKYGDARREAVAAHLGRMGAPRALIETVMTCATTDAMLEPIERAGMRCVFDALSKAAAAYCMERARGDLSVDVAIVTQDGVLGQYFAPKSR